MGNNVVIENPVINSPFAEHISQRTGTAELQEKAASLLLNWFVHGRTG